MINKLLNKIRRNKAEFVLLSISAISFLVFLKLLDSVLEQGRVTLFDKDIVTYIYTIRTPFLTEFMKLITSLGNTMTVAISCLVAIVVLYLAKKNFYIILLIVSLVINSAFVWIIKILINRPRPPIAYALVTENSFSFPSGHSIIAICFYGIIFYFIFHAVQSKKLKILTLIAGTITVLLIGFSRIYLGVHWPSDVIASFAIGISWCSLLILFVNFNKQLHMFFKDILSKLSH